MADEEFEVRNPRIESALRDIAKVIGAQIPNDFGFTLMIFSFTGPDLFYISDANRSDMIKTMKEFIAKQEKEPTP